MLEDARLVMEMKDEEMYTRWEAGRGIPEGRALAEAWKLKQPGVFRTCLELLDLEESSLVAGSPGQSLVLQDPLLQSQDPPNHWNWCLFHKILPQSLLLINSNPLFNSDPHFFPLNHFSFTDLAPWYV